jgi:hypothetical protein
MQSVCSPYLPAKNAQDGGQIRKLLSKGNKSHPKPFFAKYHSLIFFLHKSFSCRHISLLAFDGKT